MNHGYLCHGTQTNTMSHDYAIREFEEYIEYEPMYDDDDPIEPNYSDSDSEPIDTPDIRLDKFMNDNPNPIGLSNHKRVEFTSLLSEYRRYAQDYEIPYNHTFERRVSVYSRRVWSSTKHQ